MSPNRITLDLPSPEATDRVAARIGSVLRSGDCLLLDGPVGAGKSHFARALIQSRLAVCEDVPSPTYTLVQTYVAEDGTEIWHADLYRLTSTDEVIELGLTDAWSSAICLIEWPDRLGDLVPVNALAIDLHPDVARPERREFQFRWSRSRWDVLHELDFNV